MILYSDQPGIEVSTLVDAPPAVLWDLVTDINLPAKFSTEFQHAHWLDPFDGPSAGAMFQGHNKHPLAGEWQVECRIDWFEVEHQFGWQVLGDDGGPASWRFTLTPEGSRTRLALGAVLGPGRSGLSRVIDARPDKEADIVAGRLDEWRGNMTATITGIKALAESGR